MIRIFGALLCAIAGLWTSPAAAQTAVPADFVALIEYQSSGLCANCPRYVLELRGDGTLVFESHGYALVDGRHVARLDPARLVPLVTLIRDADYFAFPSSYTPRLTDSDTVVTTISLDGKTKRINDYRGGADRPPQLTQIEQMIDQIADIAAWTRGNDRTLAMLEAEGWDFRAAPSGVLLLRAVESGHKTLVESLIDRGAPMNGRRPPGEYGPTNLLAAAAARGDIDLYHRLAPPGRFDQASQADRDEALAMAVRAGQPQLVAEVLRLAPNVDATGPDGRTALSIAAQALAFANTANANARLDVFKALLASGANPNLGAPPPLFSTNSEDAALLLIEAGANINASANGRSVTDIATQRRWTRVQALLDETNRPTALQRN